MNLRNFEFKARVKNPGHLELMLLELQPDYKGEDHQTDTYFNVSEGRLKLREGNIENALIYYERSDLADAKQSDVVLFKHQRDNSLKEILTKVNGIKVVVKKKRRIYYIGNIKFHFDVVEGLGNFVEVEAIDDTGTRKIEELKEQCSYYFAYFGLEEADYADCSYSDMLLRK